MSGQERNFSLKSGVPIQESENMKIGRGVPLPSNKEVLGERPEVP